MGTRSRGAFLTSSFLVWRKFWHVFEASDSGANKQAFHRSGDGPVEGENLDLPLRSVSPTTYLWEKKRVSKKAGKMLKPHLKLHRWSEAAAGVIIYSAEREKERWAESRARLVQSSFDSNKLFLPFSHDSGNKRMI